MEQKTDMTMFEKLSALNVNDHVETRDDNAGHTLTYLSWPWAVAEMSRAYPGWTYEISKNENGLPYVYDPMTGYMVETSVTAGGQTKRMWLPVMDGTNRAMKAEPYTYRVKNSAFKYAQLDRETGRYFDKYGKEQKEYKEGTVQAATMFDINKAIMRCLVKNLAMFGLGLYIYAGEDLPDADSVDEKVEIIVHPKTQSQKKTAVKTEKKSEKPIEKTEEAPAPAERISMDDRKLMFSVAGDVLGDARDETIKRWFAEMGIASSATMTRSQFEDVMDRLRDVSEKTA